MQRARRHVGLEVGFSRRAIQNGCNRLQDSGSVARRLGLGRICATIAREDLYAYKKLTVLAVPVQ